MEQTFYGLAYELLFMVSKAAKSIVVAYIIAISAYTTVIFGSELIGHSVLSVTDSINVLLALTVAVFAIVQGMAAYTQYEMQKNTNLIEAAKNELEKAYAPLFVVLNNHGKTDKKGIRLTEEQKFNLDLILATFTFPEPIEAYWKKNVQEIGLVIYKEETDAGMIEPAIHIPIEFRNMINSEYEQRFKEYNK